MRHLWYKWLIILVGQIVWPGRVYEREGWDRFVHLHICKQQQIVKLCILFTQKKFPTQYAKLDAKKSAIKIIIITLTEKNKEIETNKREIIIRAEDRIQSQNRALNFQNICRQSLSA